MQESILKASLRLFCKAFAAIFGISIALFLIIFGIIASMGPSLTPEKATLSLAPDAEGNRSLLPSSSPVLLRIDLTGVIGGTELNYPKVEALLLDSREDFLAPNRVKGVLLYIDSPGGTVTDSVAIYQALKRYKERFHVPIFAYVEGMCASGGYYIAAAADQIHSSSCGLIGSVGVVLGPNFNFSKSMDKLGIEALTLTQGKNKDALNPFRPWKEGEDASLRCVVQAFYQQFVTAVTENRPKLNREKLVEDYGAQIFIAPEAERLGYIDNGQSQYEETVGLLAKAAGIEGNYQVIQLKPPYTLSDLFKNHFSLSALIRQIFFLSSGIPPELNHQFLYFYKQSL
jgi:protease IV